MTEVSCSHHAGVPARWVCDDCDLNYCAHCLPQENPNVVPSCICCLRQVGALALTNTIAPFTTKLPLFFKLPFEASSLATMIVIALLWAFAGSSMPGTLWLLLPAQLAFAGSSAQLMYRLAHGYFTPPSRPLDDQPGMGFLFEMALVMFILFLGAGLAGALFDSEVMTLVLLGLGLLLLPAAVMTLVVSRDLGAAINPVHLSGIALRIGPPYLFLWFLLLLLMGGSTQAQGLFLAIDLPAPAKLGGLGLMSTYFGFVMSALMGYVAYQHHEAFGQDVAEAEEASAGHGSKPLSPPPDRIQLLITLGKLEEAETEITTRLRADPESLDLHDRMHRLLMAKRDLAQAGPHADFYISKLIAARRDAKALEVYLNYTAKLGPLEVKDGDEVVRLVVQARTQKQGKRALALLNKFAERFPGHSAIPQAWLLSAQLLSEDFHDDAKAAMVLQALIKRFPDSPFRPEAERFAQVLARLMASRTAKPLAPTAS